MSETDRAEQDRIDAEKWRALCARAHLNDKPASGLYMASKAVAHAPKWIAAREDLPVVSTWIDEAEEGMELDWPDLWNRCLTEATNAQVLIVYMEPGEVLKGAWIEVGAALAVGVPVIGVGIEEFSIAKSGKIIMAPGLDEAMLLAQMLLEEMNINSEKTTTN
ncbi:MAG: hypothetical protein ABJN42_14430 [Roseibium sp.]|uniref:hypothetical protein n=1 Tax=Roseibium sp. TaxID=1936156 RepID=UPI00329A2D03